MQFLLACKPLYSRCLSLFFLGEMGNDIVQEAFHSLSKIKAGQK
jgi:hypothetical protein